MQDKLVGLKGAIENVADKNVEVAAKVLGNMVEMDVLLVILRSISRVRMILIIVILDGYVSVRLVVMKKVRIIFMAISLYGQTKTKTPNIMAFQN